MTLLTSNQFIGMLDGVFQITFICAILLFWLCIYHGLRQVCSFLILLVGGTNLFVQEVITHSSEDDFFERNTFLQFYNKYY